MDNNQNGDMLDKAKEGAKKLLSLASSPIKKYILAGVLSALPYVVIIVVALVLIIATLFSISEQLDSVYEESGKMAENIGEKMGNAITLHGFKTNEQVAADEEVDYYKRLKFFQDSMELTNYDLTLINNTVLYETNAEDTINLSNNDAFTESAMKLYNSLNQDIDTGNKFYDFVLKYWLVKGSFDQFVGTFFKNVANRYAIGFINSVAGASQYEKANKALLPVATAVKKCKDLTKDEGTTKDGTSMTVNMSDEFKTCYTGFLIAEDSEIIRQLVNINEDLSFVEDGELIYTPSNELSNELLKIFKGVDDLVFKSLLSYQSSTKFSIELARLGCLANTKDCVSKVAGYNGYIVNNLQEYYKYDVSQGDNVENAANSENGSIIKLKSLNDLSQEELDILIERYKAEDENKRAIASDIFERTDGYLDATYGQVEADKKDIKFSNEIINNEGSSSLGVTVDGQDVSISFNDYIKIVLYELYGDDIFEIDNSELMKALIIKARTIIYQKLGVTQISGNIGTNFDISEAYKNYKDGTNEQFNEFLDSLINQTSGSVIKDSSGNLNGDLNIDINQNYDNKNASDIINDVGGIEKPILDIVSPIAGVNDLRNYMSACYNCTDSVHNNAHSGDDFKFALGTNVSSVTGGIVVASYNSCGYSSSADNRCGPTGYGGYGNIVVIQSSDANGVPIYIYYAHMNGGSVNVNVGDTVVPGQVLGQVGSSGSSTGPHLHFEVRYGSNDKNHLVDPLKFFGL